MTHMTHLTRLTRLTLPSLLSMALCACSTHPTTIPVSTPTLTLNPLDKTLQSEGVTCASITAHADGVSPDCGLIYAAWVRGRNRAAVVYPAALNIKMSAVLFYRPQLYDVPEKPYPLILLSEKLNLDTLVNEPQYARGITYTDGLIRINYAYENVIEHEAVHALVFILDGAKQRDPSIATVADGGYDPSPSAFWLIACHGTPDDPFGEPGNLASCQLPFGQ